MGKYLAVMMKAGWAVTFPRFHEENGYTVVVAKGCSEFSAKWQNETTLQSELERLWVVIRTQDEAKSPVEDGCRDSNGQIIDNSSDLK